MKHITKPILNIEDSLIVCIDLQAKIMPVMAYEDAVIKNSNILLKASDILNIPVIATEQYPKGLGGTDKRIAFSKNIPIFQKTHFSIFGSKELVEEFNKLNKKNIIIFGVETHVCVYYSLRHLIENDYNVYLVSDACSSRMEVSHNMAIEASRSIGADIITTEMAIFWHIESASVDVFKPLSALIR